MTINRLYGIPVLTDEWALSPLSKVKGYPIRYKRIRQLTLSNGDVWYCDDRYEQFDQRCGTIRAYVAKRDGNPVGRPAPTGEAPVNKLLRVIAENKNLRRKLAEMRKQRDTWKKRAIEAERSLSTINQAISQY